MQREIVYLDHAATTRPCEEAVAAALHAMRDCFGNPSSLHALGADAARALGGAREPVAALLGCETESVCFTSGGSEANMLAVLGGARARRRVGSRVVTTAVEHPSVAGALARLEEDGWEVVRVKPRADGSLDPEEFIAAVNEQTALCSLMQVNNETGALFPVAQIAKRLRTAYPRLLIHSDGVQAFGKLPLRLSHTEIDLYSVSGHKIYAPKGAGALYIRRGVRIAPLILGGGQERGLRAGTEGLPMIAAFGAAAARLQGAVPRQLARARLLQTYLRGRLAEISQVCINSPTEQTPYILNLSIPGWRGETMLHFLESRDVYLSSGSACSKGAYSPVLRAMGLEARLVQSALRVSLGHDTTEEQLDRLVLALREGIAAVAHE